MTFGMVNAALVHRFRTGEGQHVDVSLVSASLGLLPDPAAIFFATGERPKRAGNRNLNLSPAEAFQAKDGFVNVVLLNPEQWGRFCQALGDKAMETDPRFADNPARLRQSCGFQGAGGGHPRDRLRDRLGGAPRGGRHRGRAHLRVPRGLRGSAGAPPGARGRGGATRRGQGEDATFPGRASRTPPRIDRPAPLLGQHTAEVLGELGLSRAEIDRLAAAGVIVLGQDA